jgi:hypothetical protein
MTKNNYRLNTPKSWQIFAIIFSFIIVIIMIGLMISSVHGQLTDSKYITCIIMEMTGIQVVLETSESCPIELWTEAVKYYTSQGYVRTSYSNVFGDHPIITLTKEGE